MRTVPGVKDVQPVYIARVGTELRVVGKPSRSIRVIGVPLEGRVFESDWMDEKRSMLRANGTALLDNRTKRMYGLIRNDVQAMKKQQVELFKSILATWSNM